jgi:hypothetical protein
MFNLVVMSVAYGWVNFSGVGEGDYFWLFWKISGCDLCNQFLMGETIVYGSIVGRVV